MHLTSDLIEVKDAWDCIEYCYRENMTDGLPIVPPTEQLVQKFVELKWCNAGLLEKQRHQFSGHGGATADFPIKVTEQKAGRPGHLVVTAQPKVIASVLNDNTQSFFDLAQVYIKGATERGKLQAVVWFQNDLVGLYVQ